MRFLQTSSNFPTRSTAFRKAILAQLMKLPENHAERLAPEQLSLEGLAIGDAFGEMLAYNCAAARQRVERGLMGGPWFHTDDTEMALAIFEVLQSHGRIDPNELALRFAERFRKEPE